MRQYRNYRKFFSKFVNQSDTVMTYKSKIDKWLIAVVAIAIAGTIASVVIPLISSFSIAALVIGIIYSALITTLLVGIMRDTKYIIDGEVLIIRCTFLMHYKIDINSIREISDTRSIISAPALSLDRIKIKSKGGIAIISPADKTAFVSALKQINPAIKITGKP